MLSFFETVKNLNMFAQWKQFGFALSAQFISYNFIIADHWSFKFSIIRLIIDLSNK